MMSIRRRLSEVVLTLCPRLKAGAELLPVLAAMSALARQLGWADRAEKADVGQLRSWGAKY